MPNITYKDAVVAIDQPETVLEGLERSGYKVPFSCRAGICHSCMMQAEDQPPVTAQQGLSENQKQQNLFLACSCVPNQDMSINLIDDTNLVQGIVTDKRQLNDSVLGLFIEVDSRWHPGQHLNVWYDETQGRAYSIANRNDKNIIELHIKRHAQGLVSRWLHDEVVVGQTITLSKPMGNCFYSDDHHTKPILMVATGTGLAPLLGVLREALARKHKKPIYLYAGSGDPANLYYVEELKALAKKNKHVHYIPVVRRHKPANDNFILEGDVVETVKEHHTDLNDWKVFLCGNPSMIKQVQRHCFFQGAAVSDILVDAFIIDVPKAS